MRADEIEAITRPALDDYVEALKAHAHDRDADLRAVCRCGFVGRGRVPRRSVGLHVSAAERRASKAFDRRAEELLEAAR